MGEAQGNGQDTGQGNGDAVRQLAAVAASQLRAWHAAGVRRVTPLPEPARMRETPANPASIAVAPVAVAPAAPVTAPAAPILAAAAPAEAGPGGGGPEPLAAIAAAMDGCMRCSLGATRTHLVFGVGSPTADVVFVGEAPGRDEDLKGEPFVGRAGQLLTDIIEKGMKRPRASVYICNTVKCRPPENRNPEAAELAACEPFLIRQLLAIRPRVIVALGKFAAQSLCRSEAPISRLRGNWHTYEGIRIMPTYHPAYLLRNPAAKREVWEDIQQVLAELETPPGIGDIRQDAPGDAPGDMSGDIR